MLRPVVLLLSGPILLLAGCGRAANDVPPSPPQDAAIADALSDPIMTDPDLVAQNQAHAAIAVSGPVSSAFPPVDDSDEAVSAARDEAAQLAGGTIPAAPAASAGTFAPLRDAVTAAQMAVAAGVTRDDCARAVEYTARWAALLPGPLQVYPRGAVEEAAGTDAANCALRVIHFRTPVAVDDVIAFYHARLRAAGYAVQHQADGAEHALRGRKAGSGFLVYVRKAGEGLTAADIVVAGRP
jgi:hypothetical protein